MLREAERGRLHAAILTSGRFHVLDLARELARLGVDVSFLAGVPRSRAVRFGLPASTHRGLLHRLAPAFAASRVLGAAGLRAWGEEIMKFSVDHAGAARLPRCDVFIGMSGMTNRSASLAHSFGAKVVVERGSRHMLAHMRVMGEMPLRGAARSSALLRELDGYASADVVVVPSMQAVDSFTVLGYPRGRIACIPYGVDIERFCPPLAARPPMRRILFVGTWSRVKGCDTLLDAWRSLPNSTLTHVGAVGDLPLPTDKRFIHVDAVDQMELPAHYADADVFVLPSRSDGFGMVLLQAIASGVPLVASTATGAADVATLIGSGEHVMQHAPEDVRALADAVGATLDRGERAGDSSARLTAAQRHALSWERYGSVYRDLLVRLTGRRADAA